MVGQLTNIILVLHIKLSSVCALAPPPMLALAISSKKDVMNDECKCQALFTVTVFWVLGNFRAYIPHVVAEFFFFFTVLLSLYVVELWLSVYGGMALAYTDNAWRARHAFLMGPT